MDAGSLQNFLQNRVKKALKLLAGGAGLYLLAIGLNLILAFFIPKPQTVGQAIARYLPPNIIYLLVAWSMREVKSLGVRRGVGISAAFQAIVQIPPATHYGYSLKEGFVLEILPANAFGKIIDADGGFLAIPLWITGALLGVLSFYLFADNLTERTLSFRPDYTWDEMTLLPTAFILVLMLHEAGHILFGTLQGIQVTGIGLVFPVGAYTMFEKVQAINILGFWFLMMGGNLVTLLISLLSKRLLYNKFIRYMGIIASLSTMLNASVNLLSLSSDGTRLFIAYWKVSPVLGVITLVIQTAIALYSIRIFWQIIGEEAYGSQPAFHDKGSPESPKSGGLKKAYEDLWQRA